AYAELIPAMSGPAADATSLSMGKISPVTLSVLAGFQQTFHVRLGAESLRWTTNGETLALDGLWSTLTVTPHGGSNLHPSSDIDWHIKVDHLTTASPVSAIDWQ